VGDGKSKKEHQYLWCDGYVGGEAGIGWGDKGLGEGNTWNTGEV